MCIIDIDMLSSSHEDSIVAEKEEQSSNFIRNAFAMLQLEQRVITSS